MQETLAQNELFFFPMAGFILTMSLGVLLSSSPIRSLLYLVMSMLGIGLVFMAQGAVFLGGVQFAVYAGAVMVLFLMVLMLMDVDTDTGVFTSEKASLVQFIKVGAVGIFLGLSMGALSLKTYSNSFDKNMTVMEVTELLSKKLFVENMFLFEVIGLLLLVIAVGVVAAGKVKEVNK